MSLSYSKNIYNNYNNNNNMTYNMSKNFNYRLKRLETIVGKVKDVEEEVRVKDNKTKKFIKEKVNRKTLANDIKQLYEERKIRQSDKIERLLQDLIKTKTKIPIREIKK